MSAPPQGRTWDLYLRVAAVVAFMAVAALLGYGVGMLVGDHGSTAQLAKALEEATRSREAAAGPLAPPLFYFARSPVGETPETVLDEIALAARSGIHRHVLTIRVNWDRARAYTDVIDLIRRVLDADSAASLVLNLDLNPPLTWLTDRPSETVPSTVPGETMVSVASMEWRRQAAASITDLFAALRAAGVQDRIEGVMLSALEDGAWYRTPGQTAGADKEGFRTWLASRYGSDAALQRAWRSPAVSLADADIPEAPAVPDKAPVFFGADEQAHVDFLRYTSESVAEAIEDLSGAVKAAAGPRVQVLVPYGYSFEAVSNASGHLALGRVLASQVDGIVSPVSYHGRGLGETGGFMGPVNSAQARHVSWHIVDDTRTGIQRDPLTGDLTVPGGGLAQDIQNIHRRNFAYAFAHGLGLMWTDAESDGSLYDRRIWGYLATMRDAYAGRAALADDTPMAGHCPAGSATTPVALVIDEESRFWQRRDSDLNRLLLRDTASSIMQTGVPCEFVLLEDVLAERVKPASVYVFLNAFRLLPAERERLHTLLDRFNATAVWLYAPGYLDGREGSAANVTATTRIQVRQFDEPARAGSLLRITPSDWTVDEVAFGEPNEWNPLLYIDDPQADILAVYADSEAPSVALAAFEEGWTSILVAEPALPATVLYVLLELLDQHLYVEYTEATAGDVVIMGPNFAGFHAATHGEKTFRLPWPCDIRDGLNGQNLWQQRQSFSMPMRAGDTRLFALRPLHAR